MLVLSRKTKETIVIDGQITVTILQVKGKTVRLGVDAPKEVSIQREELRQRIVANKLFGHEPQVA